jgi:hypothetical protein
MATLPTSGGRWVGIVRLRTKATEISFSLVATWKVEEMRANIKMYFKEIVWRMAKRLNCLRILSNGDFVVMSVDYICTFRMPDYICSFISFLHIM